MSESTRPELAAMTMEQLFDRFASDASDEVDCLHVIEEAKRRTAPRGGADVDKAVAEFTASLPGPFDPTPRPGGTPEATKLGWTEDEVEERPQRCLPAPRPEPADAGADGVRNAALEEAAAVIELRWEHFAARGTFDEWMKAEVKVLAAAIRRLKSPTRPGGTPEADKWKSVKDALMHDDGTAEEIAKGTYAPRPEPAAKKWVDDSDPHAAMAEVMEGTPEADRGPPESWPMASQEDEDIARDAATRLGIPATRPEPAATAPGVEMQDTIDRVWELVIGAESGATDEHEVRAELARILAARAPVPDAVRETAKTILRMTSEGCEPNIAPEDLEDVAHYLLSLRPAACGERGTTDDADRSV